VEGATARACFEAMAALEAVFHGYEVCGVCGGKDTRYELQHSRDMKYTYYKVRCQAEGCGATFRFGERTVDHVLFPQLTDDQGRAKPNGGWEVYQGERKSASGEGARPVGR